MVGSIARIDCDTTYPIPAICKNRKIKKPDNPTHAAEFALAGIIGATAGYVLKKLLEDDE